MKNSKHLTNKQQALMDVPKNGCTQYQHTGGWAWAYEGPEIRQSQSTLANAQAKSVCRATPFSE
jgi:hypothetical protein